MATCIGDSEITKSDKYSILLPTYNERENLPIIVWLIIKYLDGRYNIYIYNMSKSIKSITNSSIKYFNVILFLAALILKS